MHDPIFDDPSFQKGMRQANRGETFYVFPIWKRIFNPFRRVKFWYNHTFGKWKHLNDK